MTKKMMEWFISKLQDTSLKLAQVESYEGQFEDLDHDTTIFTPAAFVLIEHPENVGDLVLSMNYNVSVYLITTHIHGATYDSMLDLIDTLISYLHSAPVRFDLDKEHTPPTQYFGRCFFLSADYIAIFPGKCAYKLNFIVKA